VVLCAAIGPSRDWVTLGFCVVAFFLAVGLAAHALDELYDRPPEKRALAQQRCVPWPRWISSVRPR
jgi:hypothetical protein